MAEQGNGEDAVCECGAWASECDRDHDAEEAAGNNAVIYDDGTVVPLCPVCHSTGCEHPEAR